MLLTAYLASCVVVTDNDDVDDRSDNMMEASVMGFQSHSQMKVLL